MWFQCRALKQLWPLNCDLCISNPLIMSILSPNPSLFVCTGICCQWLPSSSWSGLRPALAVPPRSSSLFRRQKSHFGGHRGNPGFCHLVFWPYSLPFPNSHSQYSVLILRHLRTLDGATTLVKSPRWRGEDHVILVFNSLLLNLDLTRPAEHLHSPPDHQRGFTHLSSL